MNLDTGHRPSPIEENREDDPSGLTEQGIPNINDQLKEIPDKEGICRGTNNQNAPGYNPKLLNI